MAVAVQQQTFPAPLPEIRTTLRGRTSEMAALREMLLAREERLVTIAGPGGVGKTSLALHSAHDVAGAFDGMVAFVPLAAIRQAPLALLAIGQALGMVADPHHGYEDALVGLLKDRRALIVLDNLEQVVEVAPAIGRLVEECPGIVILATSQVALGLEHERVVPLSPLPTINRDNASGEELAASDAVALFLDRAREVTPGFIADEAETIAIARLCARLDGLPLAIELAAARANLLSPKTMLERIDSLLETLGQHRGDVPDRLRTMRAAIAWSYDLLEPGEQLLLRRVAVFEAGVSPEAAAYVVGDGMDVTHGLRTLTDRNLMYVETSPHEDPRYHMLQTIRAFGIEQLRERGEEDDARRAHADYIVRLAERAEPYLVTADQTSWMARLDRERENIRTVVEWALENDRNEIVFRIVGAAWRYMTARGLIPEGRAWLDRALAGEKDTDVSQRARALVAAGYFAEDARDMAAAEQFLVQARYLAIAIGDRATECLALNGLAMTELDRADFPASRSFSQEALILAREIGDRRSAVVALGNLAGIDFQRGLTEDAIEAWKEATTYLQELGDRANEGVVLMNIGCGKSQLGHYEEAMALFDRALHLQRSMNFVRDYTFTLMNIGDAAMLLGQFDRAREALDEATPLLKELDAPDLLAVVQVTQARIAFREGDDAACASSIIESMGMMENGTNTLVFIEAGLLLAQLCARRRMFVEAIDLLRGIDQACQRVDVVLNLGQREDADEVRRQCIQALGASARQSSTDPGLASDDQMFSRHIASIARQVIGRQHAGTLLPSSDVSTFALTPREIDVLMLLATGKTTREVASMLDISPRTVATHAANILEKMEVGNRAAAVALAARHGVISLDEQE